MKNADADTVKSDQDRNIINVFNNNNVAEKWRRIYSFNRVANQEKVSLILRNNNVKKCWISDSAAW